MQKGMHLIIEIRMSNMETYIKRWLQTDGEVFLRKAGIEKGQSILDFGCGTGNYAIPAAKIAGDNGKVYALDKDERALSRVEPKARISGLSNIEIMKTAGELEVHLGDASVDVVLLYDVLHPMSIPEAGDRKRLLNELYRLMKPGGLLSVYPMHRDLQEVKEEVENTGFNLEKEHDEAIISYAGEIDKARILSFRKQ